MAKLYKTDGTVEEVKPEGKGPFTLKELQEFVGGTIDIVYLPSGRQMIVNDEGKLIGLSVNEKATEEWKKEFPIEQYPINNDGLIVGDALIAEDQDMREEEDNDEEDSHSPAVTGRGER
jgi:hypothetical protein